MLYCELAAAETYTGEALVFPVVGEQIVTVFSAALVHVPFVAPVPELLPLELPVLVLALPTVMFNGVL
jgi:hypothetical protein